MGSPYSVPRNETVAMTAVFQSGNNTQVSTAAQPQNGIIYKKRVWQNVSQPNVDGSIDNVQINFYYPSSATGPVGITLAPLQFYAEYISPADVPYQGVVNGTSDTGNGLLQVVEDYSNVKDLPNYLQTLAVQS